MLDRLNRTVLSYILRPVDYCRPFSCFYIQRTNNTVNYSIIDNDKNDMFPGMPVQGSKQERQLIKIFKSLSEDDKSSLLAFSEFLVSRSKSLEGNTEKKEVIPTEPLNLPRPDEESVVKAIKRLTANYPMVDKESILHPISGLMSEHIMKGRDASDIIDELESLFENEYTGLDKRNETTN